MGYGNTLQFLQLYVLPCVFSFCTFTDRGNTSVSPIWRPQELVSVHWGASTSGFFLGSWVPVLHPTWWRCRCDLITAHPGRHETGRCSSFGRCFPTVTARKQGATGSRVGFQAMMKLPNAHPSESPGLARHTISNWQKCARLRHQTVSCWTALEKKREAGDLTQTLQQQEWWTR